MTELKEQAAKILGPLSGTTTVWGIDLGLRLGVFRLLADRPAGAAPEEVADALDLDPQYAHVVLRAAYAAEVLDFDHDRYRLADHMATLLLDADATASSATRRARPKSPRVWARHARLVSEAAATRRSPISRPMPRLSS